ncbi:MAG: S8 family peptidase [Flavobacteriales bacterium]|nr:S8 family peptidase [Flavobacteriales bacterium]
MKAVFTMILVALISVVIAQSHVQNQLIVQLHYQQSVDEAVETAVQLVPGAEFKILQPLSKTLNIWLIGYKEAVLNASKAIDILKSIQTIALAQVNHTGIENRNQPDDANYGQQWCHFNAADADMDTEEAWDITTGGVTALGDTIVVAVIDGGADLSHEDLDYWRNYHEIPNNGIDDDNNGYIDDYNGWHVYKNGGTIFEDEDVNMAGPWDEHGIHVSGIIGAKGNNGIGVSGVSWNVKVMAVRGSSTDEAVLVKSYGYVYDQRMIYNRSDGDSGAYVVATNSSFGVNYGLATDYPIWCGLYDSLGMVGVLSAVAGPNLGIDIDSQGDVPGTCPSNYTISTTNSRNDDTRNSGAGYGLIHCDIAAPGTDIYSTVGGDSYNTKTGTSMATPQVAGAIGLMYAAAPAAMLSNNLDYPSVTASTIRNYMLTEGFDVIASMSGESVTGGRLNLFKALTALELYDTTSTKISNSKFQVSSFKLSPNPANDVLTVFVSKEETTLKMYSILGKLIFTKKLNSFAQIDISTVESGVYFVVVSDGKTEETKRVVITH